MATVARQQERRERPGQIAELDMLRSGDHMTREEFHRSYSEMPEDFKAELIGGIVYVASPVSRRHGTFHLFIGSILPTYVFRTPGLEAGVETSAFLSDKSEPQPDLSLRVLPEHGGQSGVSKSGEFVVGAPELVIEIAYRSRSLDLHRKRDDYARAGVREYLVWVVEDARFCWFDLAKNKELPAPADGILRSFAFPGLWYDEEAVRRHDPVKLTATLEAGLATPEHAAFVKQLADAKR
jgi:Uma2 family endonuclease